MSFSIGSYTYSEITSEPRKSITDVNKVVPVGDPFLLYLPVFIGRVNIEYNNEKRASIPSPSEDVMDRGHMDAHNLANFLVDHNPKLETDYALFIASLYVQEAIHEGVNSDLAFAQMCLETGFLNYGGDVAKSQNNFCGLGATGDGAKGNSFSSPEEGVRAHIQHLKAYGSTRKLNNELVDQRFRFVERGSGVELKDLTGKWATDKLYDKKIRHLLHRMYNADIKSAS